MENDRNIAWKILNALCESSLIDEFQYYRSCVQEDLGLTNEEINRLYSLAEICRLLKPEEPNVRLYKGREVKESKTSDIFSYINPSWSCIGNICQLKSDSVIQEEQVQEHVLQEDAEQEHVVQEDATQEHVVQEHAVQEHAVQEHVAQEHVVQEEDSVRDEPIREVSVQEDAVRDEAVREVSVQDVQEDDVQEVDKRGHKSSPGKNKHPAAKAMRKLLRVTNIPLDNLVFDTEKYEKAIIVQGVSDIYREQFQSFGGKWNARLGAWVFSKQKLIEAMDESALKKQEEKEQ